MTIRVVSYNIHKCVGIDRRRRPERVADVIAAAAADILVLQEADHRLGQRPSALHSEIAERASGLRLLPFALSPVSLGWHGQAMLVHPRFSVSAIRRVELPGLEPRGAIMAEIDEPGAAFRVVGVHLGLLGRYRRMQLAAIRAALSRRTPMPTLIIGDYNEWSARGSADALGDGFRLHAPGPSFPAARPVARLDRLAVGSGLHLKAAGVMDGRLARAASDHLPVWAEIRVD